MARDWHDARIEQLRTPEWRRDARKKIRAEGLGLNGVHSSDRMGALVRETFRAMIDRVEHQFDDTDLVMSQWLTLKLIGSGNITCIGDVVRELGLESGSATRLVDQLENKELLLRKRSVTDRRVVKIALTDKGIAIVAEMQPRLVSFWDTQLEAFSAEQQELLFDLLSKLRDVLIGGGTNGSCRPRQVTYDADRY